MFLLNSLDNIIKIGKLKVFYFFKEEIKILENLVNK